MFQVYIFSKCILMKNYTMVNNKIFLSFVLAFTGAYTHTKSE